ncbi:MAG TPA: adenylate/guanylate cyclase domain-containing protein [Bacteroidia bacterium]|nr:adenylate/guanylate cyclase domain-containing protein [Bacteroidia bacterium]
MYRFFCLFLLLLILPIYQLSAQNFWKVDSLKQVIKSNANDTAKIDANIMIAAEYMNTSIDLSIKFCESGLALAQKSNNPKYIIEAMGWLAYLQEQNGNIQKAIQYNTQALTLAHKNNMLKQQATILNNLGAIYKDNGDFEKAYQTHVQSLKIKEIIHDSLGLAVTKNNIGMLFQGQGKIAEALNSYMNALKIYESVKLSKDDEGLAVVWMNIGSIYREIKEYNEALKCFKKCLTIHQKIRDKYNAAYTLNAIGGLLEEKNMLDSALSFYNAAITERTIIDDKIGVANSLKNVGNIYFKKKEFAKAEEAFQKSLAVFESVNDKWGLARVTNLCGQLYLQTNQTQKAEQFLNRSLKLSQELGYPTDIKNAAYNLQQYYRNNGDWKEALLMNDLYTKMRDSVENDNNRKNAIRTQFKYEYDKKESLLKSEQDKKDSINKAEIAKQKTVRNGFIIGFGIVLLSALIFLKQRNRIEKEKKRSEELLLNILPAEVADELKNKGYADARNYENVTVLFTDFKGFTNIAEKLTAQELVKEINACFSEFDRICEKYNIEKIKTIGDAYMAASGLPTPNQTHAEDMVNAALEMRNFMLTHKNSSSNDSSNNFFEIRIGIHTGNVVAGIVGIKKFQYDIWGDTVNTASRMESSGEAGKVNISETTYALVKNKFNCEYRGKIKAKNKGEIDMYFVSDAINVI